jgi:hypothetical protein
MLTDAEIARLWKRATNYYGPMQPLYRVFARLVQQATLRKLVRGMRDSETITVHYVKVVAAKIGKP